MTWIQTATGNKFDYANPRVDSISRIDIAHALDKMPRFAGHLNSNYTVADHCLNLSLLVPEHPLFKLQALLHDAAEAYTMDIPTPLKDLLDNKFRRIEINIESAIFEHFNVPYPLSAEIKRYDAALCRAEAFHLSHNPPLENWHEKMSDINLPSTYVQVWDKGDYLSMLNRYIIEYEQTLILERSNTMMSEAAKENSKNPQPFQVLYEDAVRQIDELKIALKRYQRVFWGRNSDLKHMGEKEFTQTYTDAYLKAQIVLEKLEEK